MADAYLVMRKLEGPEGAAMTFPLSARDTESQAKDFIAGGDAQMARLMEAELMLPTAKGYVATGILVSDFMAMVGVVAVGHKVVKIDTSPLVKPPEPKLVSLS